MSLMTVVRAAFDPRNASVAADLATHVADVVADGKIEPREVVLAAEAVVGDALATYKVSDKVLIEVPLTAAEAAERAADAADRFRKLLTIKLADRKLTCLEANELVAAAAILTIDAVEGARP